MHRLLLILKILEVLADKKRTKVLLETQVSSVRVLALDLQRLLETAI